MTASIDGGIREQIAGAGLRLHGDAQSTSMTPFRNIRQLFRGLVAALGEPEVQAAVMLAAALIVFATIFYRIVEGWSLLDLAYFSVVTIATVGYGDFFAEDGSRQDLHVGYIFTGIGIFVAAVTALAQSAMRPVAPPAEAEENSAAARTPAAADRPPAPRADRQDRDDRDAHSPLEEKQPNLARDPVRRWTASWPACSSCSSSCRS